MSGRLINENFDLSNKIIYLYTDSKYMVNIINMLRYHLPY